MSKFLDESINDAFQFISTNLPKDMEGSFLPRIEAIENYLNLQIDLRVRANDNFDKIQKSLRDLEKSTALHSKNSMLKALWNRAEELGYSPSVMATPGHIAGKYLAHLFKDDASVQIGGSDGQWGETPEQALLKLVQFVEGSAP